jgi:hypothetical protein
MIAYLSKVLTGTYAHWNENHTSLTDKYMFGFEKYDPNTTIIAKFILVGCVRLMNYYVGPDRDKKLTSTKITNKQIRSINTSEYHKIYKHLFSIISNILCLRNPNLEEKCKIIFENTFSEKFYLVKDINEKEKLKSYIFQQGEKFAQSTKIIKIPDPIFAYSFFTLLTTIIKDVESQINSYIK